MTVPTVILRSGATKLVLSIAKELLIRSFTSFRMTLRVRFFPPVGRSE